MKTHYMIDIETTGTNKETDDILEIAIVPISLNDDGYWDNDYDVEDYPVRSYLHLKIHNKRQPENPFAIEHMSKLYEQCNELAPCYNYEWASIQVKEFIHQFNNDPKFFMGWNASNFDLKFMFKKRILTPSFYEAVEGKEVLKGDAHYRVYEQTGAINLLLNSTGFSKKTLFALGEDLIPDNARQELPEGKLHDALYDCYKQINTMNGLIAIAKTNWSIH